MLLYKIQYPQPSLSAARSTMQCIIIARQLGTTWYNNDDNPFAQNILQPLLFQTSD